VLVRVREQEIASIELQFPISVVAGRYQEPFNIAMAGIPMTYSSQRRANARFFSYRRSRTTRFSLSKTMVYLSAFVQ
jgi:hypothetical protein